MMASKKKALGPCDDVAAELRLVRKALGCSMYDIPSLKAEQLRLELSSACGALSQILEALGTMPYENRTPAVHAAVARAKQVLGIEG